MPDAGAAPVVSVLMPVCNADRHLAEAIDSVLGQTFTDFEFVIIDDGSSDASPAILAAYAARDRRIRVLAQANAGIVAALNRGLAECRAPLVARMDADDVSLPTRLQRQVAFLTSHHKVAVVGTAFQLISEAGEEGPVVRRPAGDKAIKRILRHRNCLGHPTVAMRREAIIAIGGYREFARHAEDYDLWTRVAERHELANLSDCLLRYRVHRGQVSWSKSEAQVMGALAAQALADLRRKRGAETPTLPQSPDRAFLVRLGFSAAEIQHAVIAFHASRIAMYRLVGMSAEADQIRQSLVEKAEREKNAKMRYAFNGYLAWADLAHAVGARRYWTALRAFCDCVSAGLRSHSFLWAAIQDASLRLFSR